MFWLFDFVGQIANMGGGHGAVTDKEVRILLIDFAHHGAGNFYRFVMGLGFHCIGAIMAGAALDSIDVGVWYQI